MCMPIMVPALHSTSCCSSNASPLAASAAFRGTQLQLVMHPMASRTLQRTGPSSRHLLRAAIMMAGAAAAIAVAAAPAGFPLQRAQCRADTALAATSNGAGVMPAEQFSLLRITGDGRCLFRSLAQGSRLAAQEDAAGARADSGGGSGAGSGETQQQQSLYDQQQMKLLSAEAETARADELRQAICEELLQRRDEISFFIDENFDAYVARMRRPQTWGGEPELAVAAHVLQRPIAVYMQAPQQLALISRYGDEQYSGKHDAPLFFHGAGHYDLLVRQHQQLRSRL